jgi:hypothetical protein
VEKVAPAAAPQSARSGERGALEQAGLERVFEAISQSLDDASEAEAAKLLARLSLLLAEKVGDAQAVLDCVTAAQQAD